MRSSWLTHLCGVVCLVLLAGATHAEERILVKLDRIDPQRLYVAGFLLDRDQEVSVEAVGYRGGGRRDVTGRNHAWILDAQSREEVWNLDESDSQRRSRHLSEYTDEVRLKKGRYEVYYATYPYGWSDGRWWSWFSDDRHDFDYDDYEDASRDFEIVVRGEGKTLSEKDVLQFHKTLTEGAVLSMIGVKENHYDKVGLTLERPMDLQIYAIGELGKDEFYDCSWIIDTKTREKVWQLGYWDSDRAGGAKKNRKFKDTISLPAGEYAVFCVSDDSHHVDDWNSPPPSDPFFWGITIQTADVKMGQHARVHEYEDMQAKNVIVELTRLGDNEFRSEGFSLARKMKVRVYAMGEGRGREMYDYSRILDADTRDVVWEMKGRKTEHAGGASKNRVFDGVIELEKGNYMAYAVSDDSHSFDAWNASPPHDKEHWGLTLFAVDGDMKRHVSRYDDKSDESVLVKLTGVGNNADRKERFTVKKATKVSVYALGEGSRGRMYDYAWIENAETGRVVWEMSYRMTDHAGGAKKNRVFDDTLHLDAGEYIVHYESDGSHSFNRWNASPPADAFRWGVTIRLAKAKR